MLRWHCHHLGFIILQGDCKWVGTAPACRGNPNDCFGSYYLTWSKCGDGDYCISGYKVFCCTAPSPYSSVYWRGTAPVCRATCGDCHEGDVCISKSDCGDGAECVTGQKVLCGTLSSITVAELEEMVKISEHTKAREVMAMLMGGSLPVQAMGESDPGLVLASVNYDMVIPDN